MQGQVYPARIHALSLILLSCLVLISLCPPLQTLSPELPRKPLKTNPTTSTLFCPSSPQPSRSHW